MPAPDPSPTEIFLSKCSIIGLCIGAVVFVIFGIFKGGAEGWEAGGVGGGKSFTTSADFGFGRGDFDGANSVGNIYGIGLSVTGTAITLEYDKGTGAWDARPGN